MSRRQLFKIISVLVMVFGFLPWQIFAQGMSGPSFKIPRDVIGPGGFRGTSNTFILEQTAGQFVTERLTGSNFIIRSGFQQATPRPVPPSPAVPPLQGGGGGLVGAVGADPFPPRIENVAVNFTPEGQIIVSFETDEPTTAEFFYGIEQLDQRAIQEKPAFSHKVRLEGVIPGKTYLFEIKVKDAKGQETSSGERTFQVKPLPDFLPPANAANFRALAGDGKIELYWKNPADADFEKIRIVRNTVFYPQDPQDGQIIFEGTSEYFLDQGLTNGQRYYYTIFSYDKAGNYSSGVTASATPRVLAPGEAVPPEVPQEIIPEAPPAEIPPDIQKLQLEDFDFVQDGGLRYPIEGKVVIEPDKPLLILLDYDKVPEVLKTILVTLKNKEGKIFSFLLKIDSKKEIYGAKILPPEPGIYEMTLTVLDFKNQSAKEIKAQLEVRAQNPSSSFEENTQAKTLFTRVIQALEKFIDNARAMLGSVVNAVTEFLADIISFVDR